MPRARVALTVDRRGLIADLGERRGCRAGAHHVGWCRCSPPRSVAPRVRLLVADVSNGSCQPVHGSDPASAARIGSAFKLYVLHALGSAVAAGKVGWEEPLTITAQLKSRLSGVLQYEPDGTQISVQDTAAKMISISDSTAADMLINLVGRSAVEAALTATGMANPALDRPFLTTREMSVLALEHWPGLAQRYLAANEAGRRALLASTVDRGPLPAVGTARALITRDLGSLDYFASASDLCRAYASLADPHPPTRSVADRPGALATMTPASISTRLSGRQSGTRADTSHGPGDLAYLATTRSGAELRRLRARREPVATHRRGHGTPGPARGGQGGVYPGRAPLRSRSNPRSADSEAAAWLGRICTARCCRW